MPWRELKPMDQKLLFIRDYLDTDESFSALCGRYGISRKTGYKWVKRYRDEGLAGLSERSRSPDSVPHRTPLRIREMIIRLRSASHWNPGPKKIQRLLHSHFPAELIPSTTTIYHVLQTSGLVTPRTRKRRVAPYEDPLSQEQEANGCWSVDFKGQFKLGNGRWCYPLTVMDHHSRFLLGCEGLGSTKTLTSQRVFKQLFQQYGLPKRIRSDNGVPFATQATAGLSRLSVWWIRLGISPERIETGKPQQNGRHERMHRTLKQETAHPPAASMRAQQARFCDFQSHYNYHRPHEALGQETPSSHYRVSSRAWPNKLPALEYPGYYDVRKVSQNGCLYWRNGLVYVSHLLRGEWIGMEEIDNGLWRIYFGHVILGRLDERDQQGKHIPYWSIKV